MVVIDGECDEFAAAVLETLEGDGFAGGELVDDLGLKQQERARQFIHRLRDWRGAAEFLLFPRDVARLEELLKAGST